MSVLKLTKNDIIRNDDKEEKIKLKRSDLSYDSARVSGWEQANRQSLDILNDYNNRINKSEWLTKEDRENYRKALDSYIETSNYLRGINKTFGEGYTEEDEKNWNDSIASMNTGYDEISNFYSQFASDKVYNDWMEERKADDAYKANFSNIDINKASEGWQKYLADDAKSKADAPSVWEEMILRGFATSSDNLFNQTYNNIVYDYRNDTSYARPNDSWTEDEKNVFGQLYLESPAKAYAFAEERNNRTNKKAEEDKIKAIQDFATQNGWAMAGTTLASIAAAPMAWADLFNNFAKISAGRDVVDDGYVTPGEFSEAVQSGIGAHLNEYGTLDEDLWMVGGKGLGDLYGLGTSIAQSMLYGKVGKAVGSKYLPLINYFGQGAASSMSEGLEIGLSDEGAALYGIAMGAFEAIPELIGIDNFFKIGSSSTLKGFLKTVGSQAGSEFLEEGITSVLSNGADAVVAALADKGRIAYAIAAYKNEGLSDSEAKKRVIHDILGEVLYDSVAGGISGGISGGIESLGQTVLANADAKARYGDQVEGILVDAGTNKNLSKSDGKYVDKYIDKYGKNGELSGWNINHLLEMTDNAKVKSAVEAQLNKLGESGDVSKLTDVITKQVQGIELSKKEQSILDNSTYGQRVINGLDPQKIKSGGYDSEWAEKIGTRRLNAREYNNPELILKDRIKKLIAEQEAEGSDVTLPDDVKASEANIEASKDAKITIEKDGAKVEVKPTKITSIENDTMSIELDNGEVVNADEVDFGEGGVGLVYQAAKEMASRVGGFNIDTANVFVRGFNPGAGLSAAEYVHGWRAAFKFGAMNSPISALEGDVYTSKLTDKQRKDAYNFGKTFGNDSVVENANNASQSGKTKKQGKVHFDGLKHGKNLNERQRASLKGLQFIAKSLGIDIYVFESPKNAEGGRTGENGWYDPSDHSIHIDLYAGAEAEALMLFTASHELTHHIREVLPEKFNILADAVYEEYTKAYGKANFERLIDNKTDFLKEKGRITEDMSEEQAYDLAYEEVIADCFETMLVDSNAIEALSKNVYAKDKGLWEKIKDFIAKLVARITGAYKDVRPDSEEGNMFRALGSAAERLQNLWVDAIVEASGITNSMPENTVAVIKDGQFYKIRGEAAVRMSKELELTLSHETIDGKKVPMVGFPLRYFDTYNKKAAKKGFSLKDTGEVKYSYSSIAYSFFGDKKISIKDLENGSYKETEGYKRYVDQCLNNMRQSVEGFSEKSALKEITDSIDGIVEVAVAMKKAGYDILDSEGGRNIRDSKKRLLFSSLEPNSDYFTSSDISTICDKRINFAEIYDEIVRREDEMGVPKNKRFFNNIDNYFVLHKILADKGLTAPCRQCYVESMRKNLDPMANAFIELMQEKNPDNKANKQLYQPSGKNKGALKSNNAKLRENLLEVIEREQYDITADDLTIKMLTTADGLAQLKLQAPLIYEAFNSFYGQSKPKMPKQATPFRFGELTALLTNDKGKINEGLIRKIKSTGGFRLQSYSDFQIQNFADVLQVIFEAGTLGLNGHAYTKVPAFLDATKGTNLKRNISIFMYKDGGQWKIDRGDSFPLTLEEIYDIVDADKSGNTGIIAVVQNEDMAAWIMANDNVGYFIPFHKSGVKMGVVRETIVKEGGREIKGYSGIKDHTRQQTEVWAKATADHKANTKVKKGINIYEFWDFENVDNLSQKELIEKNVKEYINRCNEAGYLPKFREYVMGNGKVLNKVLAYAKELGFVSQNATIDDISFEYSGYRIPYGYYKCLLDFGMFTPDGEASPIERLSLKDYNFGEAVEFFSDAETRQREEILQQFENGFEREKYRNSDMTTAELAEEVQKRRNQVVDEVVSGEYKNAKYSDRDSLGNELSQEQQEFFKDSKVRDEDGNLLVLYHGTTKGGFTVFDAAYSDDRRSLFFTSSKKTAQSYGITGNVFGDKDFEARPPIKTIDDAKAYFDSINWKVIEYKDGKYWDGKTLYQQWNKNIKYSLQNHQGHPKGNFNNEQELIDYAERSAQEADNRKVKTGLYEVYLNLKKPLIVDAKGHSWDQIDFIPPELEPIVKKQKENLQKIGEKIKELRAYSKERGISLSEAMDRDREYAKLGDEDVALQEEYDAFMEENGLSMDTSTRDISKYAKNHGYDGVLFKNIYDVGQYDIFGDTGMAEYIAVAFDSNQVKSASNKNPTSNPDIQYSDRKQVEVYHGSKADFEDFDFSRLKDELGVFFAENENDASQYGDAKAYTLSPKKTLVVHQGDEYRRLMMTGETDAEKRARLLKEGYDTIKLVYNKPGGGETVDWVALTPDVINKTKYSDRDTDSVSNRSLLAGALESVAQNDIEKKKLDEYKAKIALIEAEQKKLGEIRAKANELRFTKGRTAAETKQMKDLDFEATQIANRINTYDKQLLNLESTKALKNVLDREKANLRKRLEQKGKQALKDQKQKDAQTIRELMNRHTESRKKAIEGRHKTEMKRSIRKILKRLNKLFKGGKERNVKEGMKETVATALALGEILFNNDISNRDIVNLGVESVTERESKLLNEYRDLLIKKEANDERIKSIREGEIKDTSFPYISDLEAQNRKIETRIATLNKELSDLFVRERARLNRTPVSELIYKLAMEYHSLQESKDEYIKRAYESELFTKLIDLKKELDGVTARDMSMAQLEKVHRVFTMIEHSVRTANQYFRNGKFEDLQTSASAIMEEIDRLKDTKQISPELAAKAKSFLWNELTPYYAFDKIGSETFMTYFLDLLKGQAVAARDVKEAQLFAQKTREKYGYSKWNLDKVYDFKLKDGRTFSTTLKHMLSVYAYSKREQADSHMRVGGFFHNDKATFRKEKGILKMVRTDAVGYKVDADVLEEIKTALGKEKTDYVDEMLGYLTKMGEKGNEVTRILWGVDIFKEKVYFPLQSKDDFLKKSNETAQAVSLKNDGMTKETTPNASNPIVLEAFDDVWGSHVERMSQYHGMVVPIDNLNKVLHYGTWAGTESMSVSTLLEGKFTSAATDYLEQFINDLNGGAASKGVTNPFWSFFGKWKKTKVGASLSTIVQQPTAIIRAMAEIDAKYFVGKPNLAKLSVVVEEMQTYAPIAIVKEIGGFDAGAGKQTARWINSDTLTGIDKVGDTIDNWSMKGAEIADQIGWAIIWEAVKRETKATTDLKWGSQEFLEKCGERAEEVINKTQVYDSVLSRSGFMRSKNDSVKMLTSFMGEPTLSMNMLYNAVINAKRGGKEAKAKAARTIGCVYASIILAEALAAAIYALRDDDEDESYLEKYLQALGDGILTDIILAPVTSLPAVKDVVSVFQGWNVDRSDMAIFVDIKNAFDGLDSESKSTYRKIEDFSGAIAAAFGVPLKNVLRTGREIYNAVENITDGISGVSGSNAFLEGMLDTETSKSNALYKAIVNGDDARLDVYKKGYKTTDAYESAVRKALRDNDPRIKEAAQARYEGDISEYTRIAKQIIAQGKFSQDTIVAAINAELNAIKRGEVTEVVETEDEDEVTSIYSSSDINVAFNNGDTDMALEIINDLIETKMANGMEEKNARSSIKSSITSYWKPLYKQAYEMGDSAEMYRIRTILLASGLYGSANDVVKTVWNWVKS